MHLFDCQYFKDYSNPLKSTDMHDLHSIYRKVFKTLKGTSINQRFIDNSACSWIPVNIYQVIIYQFSSNVESQSKRKAFGDHILLNYAFLTPELIKSFAWTHLAIDVLANTPLYKDYKSDLQARSESLLASSR